MIEATPGEVREAVNGLGRAWRVLSSDLNGAPWETMWQLIGDHPDSDGLILNVALNCAQLAVAKLAEDAGEQVGVDAGEAWSPSIGEEAPEFHRVLGPLLACVANGDVDAASDVVLGLSDPGNDWLLKSVCECLAIATGCPAPDGWYDLSFVVEKGGAQ